MNAKLERTSSIVLTVAAVAIAGAAWRRELKPPAPAVVRGSPKPPERVTGWTNILSSGVIVGRADAPVKIVEFGDFECPFCKKFADAVHRARERFGDKVAFVFVHYPLQSLHRFAMPAAKAAECAASQDRFGPFHDVLFQKQDSLGLKSWESFATEAGVPNSAVFSACNSANGSSARIAGGIAIGKALGISATPTVLINGWRFFVPPNDSTLIDAVAQALEGKEPLGASVNRER